MLDLLENRITFSFVVAVRNKLQVKLQIPYKNNMLAIGHRYMLGRAKLSAASTSHY